MSDRPKTGYENYSLEELVEALRNAGFEFGVWTGVSQAIDWLRARSGEHFTRYEDSTAMSLRMAADTLEHLKETLRMRYDNEVAPEVEKKWREVEYRQEKIDEALEMF